MDKCLGTSMERRRDLLNYSAEHTFTFVFKVVHTYYQRQEKRAPLQPPALRKIARFTHKLVKQKDT